MIARVCAWLSRFLTCDALVGDDGKTPYLIRYHLLTVPWLPQVYLHHIVSEDPSPELHDHPWAWAASLILSGAYIEERLVAWEVVPRLILAWALNVIGPTRFHRITGVLHPGVWTLFVAGPRRYQWGFYDPTQRTYAQSRPYMRALRERGSLRGKVTGPEARRIACTIKA